MIDARGAHENHAKSLITPFRRDARIATGAVGLITEPQQAEAIIAGGQADAVLLARAFLRDPYWTRHAALALQADSPWPIQYARA